MMAAGSLKWVLAVVLVVCGSSKALKAGALFSPVEWNCSQSSKILVVVVQNHAARKKYGEADDKNNRVRVIKETWGQTLPAHACWHMASMWIEEKSAEAVAMSFRHLKTNLSSLKAVLIVNDSTYVHPEGLELLSTLVESSGKGIFYGGSKDIILSGKELNEISVSGDMEPSSTTLVPAAKLPIVMSREPLEYIIENAGYLQLQGGNDNDIELSVAVWLLIIGAKPQDLSEHTAMYTSFEKLALSEDQLCSLLQKTIAFAELPFDKDFWALNKFQKQADCKSMKADAQRKLSFPPVKSDNNTLDWKDYVRFEIVKPTILEELPIELMHEDRLQSYMRAIVDVKGILLHDEHFSWPLLDFSEMTCHQYSDFPLVFERLTPGTWGLSAKLYNKKDVVATADTLFLATKLPQSVLGWSKEAWDWMQSSVDLIPPSYGSFLAKYQRDFTGPIRVGLLLNGYGRESTMTRIWTALAQHLPRETFYLEGLGVKGENEILQAFIDLLVPVHIMSCLANFDSLAVANTMEHLLTSGDLLEDMKDSELYHCLAPYHQWMRMFDALIFPNSLDDPNGKIIQYLAALAVAANERRTGQQSPALICDLPNTSLVGMVRVQGIAAPSVYAARAAFEQILPEQQDKVLIRTIYPAISPIDFQSTRSSVLSIGFQGHQVGMKRPVIGMIGRLDGITGVGNFIAMAWHIHQELPEVRFLVAGWGVLESLARRTADRLGLPMRFLGRVEGTEKERFLEDIFILVRPALCETFGMGSIEARARGIPVIGLKLCGQIESIGIGGGGFLADYSAEGPSVGEALANEAIRLLKNRTILEEGVSKFNATIFQSIFTPDHWALNYGNLIQDSVALFRDSTASRGDLQSESIVSPNTSTIRPTLRIGHSPAAAYLQGFLASLFSEVYPNCEILVELLPERNPNFFVVSVLDGKEMLQSLMRQYPGSLHILVSGEPWDLSNAPIAQEKYTKPVVAPSLSLVLHAVSDQSLSPCSSSNRIRCFHLPNFVTAFYEMELFKPTDLLRKSLTVPPRVRGGGRGVAYLYSRCDRADREHFFALLRGSLPAKALGACQGAGLPPMAGRREERYSNSWHDIAVTKYSGFDFVVAFENTVADGYITEKLVTAMLSGAIPIYYGAPNVGDFFNKKALVDCGDFDSLDGCAEQVVKVYNDQDMFQEILAEPWFDGPKQLESFLGYFPEIDGGVNKVGGIYQRMKDILRQDISKIK